jgi:RNA polymerase sigma factor (sigma-70 family)
MSRALQHVVRHFGRMAVREAPVQPTDVELLQRFVTDRDAGAFEILVWRHGAMVRDVCGRGAGCDADDVFQATFLALVRHARTIRRGESLAGWLYRVARRLCVRARRQSQRRTGREYETARSESVFPNDFERSELRELLYWEIEQLPAIYREALILCHLEQRAHHDAARELGCALGTLHSRLARAKSRLRTRLLRRGVVLPAIATGALSARLVHATVNAAVGFMDGSVPAAVAPAVALSKGVLNNMLLTKMKYVVVALTALVALGSSAVLLDRPAATAAPSPAEPTIEDLKRENERLRREVASLREQLDEVGAIVARLDDSPPSDSQVLRALPKVATGGGVKITRDDVKITREKLLDRVDPPRFYPMVGIAQLRHCHWKCTVHFTETIKGELPFPYGLTRPRVEVVYIDRDTLVPVKEK